MVPNFSRRGVLVFGLLTFLIVILIHWKAYGTYEMGMTGYERIRENTLEERCTLTTKPTNPRPPLLYSEKLKMASCKVAKTGSSFLVGFFKALETAKEVGSVFSINRNSIHYEAKMIDWTKVSEDQLHMKMVVARDPYQRLFSVYIDKVYLLGSIGRTVEKFTHHVGKRNDNNTCGYDVNFQNFLDMVVNGIKNPHWQPVSDVCKPCEFRYDVICKTETLGSDLDRAMLSLNLSDSKQQSIRQFLTNVNTQEQVYSLVSAYLSDYKTYARDCPNSILLMEKIWKVFQIQGYIHIDVPVPVEDFGKLKQFTDKDVSTIIMNGVNARILSKAEKLLQRRMAVVDGYRDIRTETIEKIKQIYKDDFFLFDYDKSPPGV